MKPRVRFPLRLVFLPAAAGLLGWGAAAAAQPTAPRPGGVFLCTTILHLERGQAGPPPARAPVRIKVRYRAVPLSPETLKAMGTNPRARAFFNGRVLRRLMQLTNEVPLRIGPVRLEPGTHDAGFRCEGRGRWRFVVVDRAGKVQLSHPLAVTRAEAEIPCLNVSLLPAGQPRRFLLAARYGTLRGTLTLQREAGTAPAGP